MAGRHWKRFRQWLTGAEGAGTMPMLVLIVTAILLVLGTVALRVTTSDIQASANNKMAVEARYVAEAGAAHAKSAMSGQDFTFLLANFDSSLGRPQQVDSAHLVFADTMDFGRNGRYKVTLYDNQDGDGDPLADADNRIFVRSTGILNNGAQRVVEVVYAKVSVPTISERGAIVSAYDVETLGNITVDGRDHDLAGNYTGVGTKGIVTNMTYSHGGSSDIGGTDDFGTDVSPTRNAAQIATVVDEGAGFPVPPGPDEALGMASGTLEAMAKSGAGGSQYVTDPGELTIPMSGVTYVHLACGETWQSMDMGASEGVLVVHSDCKDATIKNLNGGTFKGILIADDIVHIHNDIIGMVMQISDVWGPGHGRCIGNGSGRVLYSSIAISQALSSLSADIMMVAYREL